MVPNSLHYFVPGTLAQGDQVVDEQVVPYLISSLGVAQSEVVEIARTFVERGEVWTNRAVRIVSMIRDWRSPQSAELFESLARTIGNFMIRES